VDQQSRHAWLDLARGISALAVCAGHLRAVMWADFPQVVAPSLLDKALYAATGLGHQAVIVFFVLSGFFVGGSVVRSKQHFDWASYCAARVARLWTVLVPCLLLTFLLDLWVQRAWPQALDGSWTEIWHSGPSRGNYDAGMLTLVGNLLFLQTILVPVFGSNGPLWSLAYEFWYYVLFPLLMVAAGQLGGPVGLWQRIGAGAMAAMMLAGMPGAMLEGFVVWLMGVAVYVACTKKQAGTWWVVVRRALPLWLMLFAIALGYAKSAAWQANLGIPADVLVGMSFALTCLVLVRVGQHSRAAAPLLRLGRALSEISYSLYLAHFPIVILIGASVYGAQRMQPSVAAITAFAGWLTLLVCSGAGVWWICERHTPTLRRLMLQYLNLLAKRAGKVLR
jgi:peptidoglycan/LPS O-acetylase OafA/YrhL